MGDPDTRTPYWFAKSNCFVRLLLHECQLVPTSYKCLKIVQTANIVNSRTDGSTPMPVIRLVDVPEIAEIGPDVDTLVMKRR